MSSNRVRYSIEWRNGDKGLWREQDSFTDEDRARRFLSMLQNQSRLVRQYLGKDKRGKYQPIIKYRMKVKPVGR